jgi:hypothetical protein
MTLTAEQKIRTKLISFYSGQQNKKSQKLPKSGRGASFPSRAKTKMRQTRDLHAEFRVMGCS